MYSCHSILERYNLFSGVKLSIRSCCFISEHKLHEQLRLPLERKTIYQNVIYMNNCVPYLKLTVPVV